MVMCLHVHILCPCVWGGVGVTLFLEHASMGSTIRLCCWNNVKPTGHPPPPHLGANSDIYVREVLPHASSHLLARLREQNGDPERHGKARATAVSWPKDTCPRGVWHNPGHPCFAVHSGSSTCPEGLFFMSFSP